MKQISYSQSITSEDFDFRIQNNNTSFKEESLILDYLGIILSIIFITFLFHYVHIDINLSLDNLLTSHSIVFKYKLY